MNIDLTAMMGIPGSGKSYAVNRLTQGFHARGVTVVCPDEIREELCDGNRADMSRNAEVFEQAHDRALAALLEGHDVVFDATNVTPMARINLLGIVKTVKERQPDWDVRSILAIIQTPHMVSWQRNADRTQWQVPGDVMLKMIGQFERSLGQAGYEGWDALAFWRPT